jgi:hypothetical protein
MGASPSIGLPDLDSLTNKGASIRKRVPIVGVLSTLPIPGICGPERAASGMIPDPVSASG